jgi:hypothetical protein
VRTLEDLLLETGVISTPQLGVAQRDAALNQKRLPQTLIDLGFLSDRQFAEWISEVTKVPLVDPLPAEEVQKVERRVPRAIAREYEIVPLAVEGNTLIIATINPLDTAALGVVRTTSGMDVRPLVAVYGSVREMVARFYPEDSVESTMQPEIPFDPSSTLAVELAKMKTMDRPFEFGSDTLLSSQNKPLELEEPPSSESDSSRSQLDRIEHQLSEVLKAVSDVKRRMDAIDSVLARVLTRD